MNGTMGDIKGKSTNLSFIPELWFDLKNMSVYVPENFTK